MQDSTTQKQGLAMFNVLGIELPLAPGDSFYDCGYVDDIDRISIELAQKHGMVNQPDQTQSKAGYHVVITRGIDAHVYIAYLRFEGAEDVYVRGHEETHALECFMRIDLLEKKIQKECGRLINLQDICDPELVADIGGVYALNKYGHVLEIPGRMPYDVYRRALEIFCNAKPSNVTPSSAVR